MGWKLKVNLLYATLVVNTSSPDQMTNNVFKGLAIANRSSGPALFATNFRAGKVFVFDSSFKLVAQFTDPHPPLPVPNATAGWPPFGIATTDALLYVTFAAPKNVNNSHLTG